MEWFRWYHGATSDPKWPLIARKAGVSVGVVVSVWAALLEHASQDEERGSVDDFDGLTFDVLYGYEDGTCAAVIAAMQERGVIINGCVSAWSKRQVQDEGAAERKRLQREREKLEKERSALEAERHALSQISADSAQPVTACHGLSRPVTECHLEQNREEKKREDIRTPLTPQGGEGAVAPDPVRRGKQPVAYSEDFEHFWQLYPRKIGKDAAWRVYQRRKHEIPTGENMAAILARHVQTEQWQREGGQYIPHPATWLNQGRWADDVTTAVGTASREVPPSPEAQRAMEEILRERTPEELQRNSQAARKIREEWLRKRAAGLPEL